MSLQQCRKIKVIFILVPSLTLCCANAMAMQITKNFSFGGIMAGIYQYQSLSDAPGFNDTGRGIYSFQPEVWFTPTQQDVFYTKLGFAAGNGLNDPLVPPFLVNPWGGVDIKGNVWGRPQDNIGIGYAFLDGGNKEIEIIQAFEAYVRFVHTEYIASTLDLQYQRQDQRVGASPKGFIPGVRLTAEF